jgi:anti-sigma B factor antagonist
MRINERQFGDVVVLDLHGAIAGAKAVAMVESTVRRLCGSGIRHVVASLADVPHVDLGGLGALVDAHRYARQANGTFKLARITKRIHDLIVVTRLLTVFDTYDSVEEAVGGSVPAYAGVEMPAPSPMSLGMVQRFLGRA